jgi:hypothetical protein
LLFPGGGGGNQSEDLVISLSPNVPGCYGKDLHKGVMLTICFGLGNGIKEIERVVPTDIEIWPAGSTEGALEQRVIGELFCCQATKDTVVIITIYLAAFPF